MPPGTFATINTSIIMTNTAAFQAILPAELPPQASADTFLERSDLARLYLSSKSCPDLRAESEASDDSDVERPESPDTASFDRVGSYRTPSVLDEGQSSRRPGLTSDMASRRKLQWEFEGLTLWLELEEFDNDLTRAVEDFSSKHASPFIPKPHTTAIYGMKHLSADEARERLGMVRKRIDQWPTFARPTGVQSDVAQCGRPGQVCSIAWSELTLATDDRHESALDELYDIFFGPDGRGARERPWKPHNSIAYDNPETNSLSLLDTVMYASRNPSLLGKERRVEAISLWSTVGKMEEWNCIDRVRFW